MEQNPLSQNDVQKDPLTARPCPASLQDYVGQKHLLGKGEILYSLIEKDTVPSMIFWGPPSVGKMTFARIIARQIQTRPINFSVVTSGIREIKVVMKKTEDTRLYGRKMIMLVDEIHRFNKVQQDVFLPYMEKGSIILTGAITENPSSEVNAAFLSCCKVFVPKALKASDLMELLKHALQNGRGFGLQHVLITEEQLYMLAVSTNEDARTVLSTLEMVVLNGESSEAGIVITREVLEQYTSRKLLLYNRQGEEHYNLTNILHRSMCNPDMGVATHQFARMLEAGGDSLYAVRRSARLASKDIGMVDSRALEICVAAYRTCHLLGMPGHNIYLTHAVTYLSFSPRSNALYMAYDATKEGAMHMLNEPVSLQIRSVPTSLMKGLHYGEGYQYAHDTQEKLTSMECMPGSLKGREYCHPTVQGNEARVSKRLQGIKEWKRKYQNR